VTHRRRLAPIVLLALVALAAPAGASASAYQRVERSYARVGRLLPCQFSSGTLSAALKEAPAFDLEYEGDLIDAIHQALDQQAGGGCATNHRARRTLSIPLPAAVPAPRPPGSITAGTGAGLPLPLVLLLAFAALGAAGAFTLGAARRLGWDPRWAQAVRHAWGEAEYRVSGAWTELRDRLGT
jgi:hypothetical protein